MSDIVLIHGAYHGGWAWERLAPLLEAAGHRVFAPTLPGLGDRHGELATADLTAQIASVAGLVEREDLRDFVLVGHSFGGLVVSGVATLMPERIARMVFLDALVPEDGQSFFDCNSAGFRQRLEAQAAAGDGLSVPPVPPEVLGVTEPDDIAWVAARVTPHPIASFREPVRVSAASRALPSVFIHCTRSGFTETTARCRSYGWPVVPIDSGHEPMVTAPAALAAVLLPLVAT